MESVFVELAKLILACCSVRGDDGPHGLSWLDDLDSGDPHDVEEILIPRYVIHNLRCAVADSTGDESWRPKRQ